MTPFISRPGVLLAVQAFRCACVAAIVALGVLHAYLFHINHTTPVAIHFYRVS